MPKISLQESQKSSSATGFNKNLLKHAAAVVSILLAVYLATMPVTIALEDDGLFILSSSEPGVSHPPGYPLHTIIGHVFSKIPIGSIAARVHAVSALFGALTCMMIFLLIDRLVGSRSMAYLGALSYGLSLRFWSQSLIAEVYTLNTFLFFLLLYLCIRFAHENDEPSQTAKTKWIIAAPGLLLGSIAFVYGLGLANHWPLIVLSTPALLVILWTKRFNILSALGSCIALTIAGLAPYLWMYFHSQADPYISFYGPLENLSDLWFYISREGYSGADSSASADLTDKLLYLGFFFRESIIQFGIVGFCLSALGLGAQFKYLGREVAVALILAYLGNGVLLVLLLGFDYQLVQQIVFRVYPLIAYGVMSIWLAIGAYWLIDYLYLRATISISKPKLGFIFTIAIVTLILGINLSENYRHDYIWAEDYSKFILGNLDKDAILIATDDVAIGTVGYMNLVQKIRPDITLYNKFGLLLGNRLFSPIHDSAETGEQALAAFIKQSQQPVYFLNELDSPYGKRSYLFYYEVDKSTASGSTEISLSQENLNFLISLVNQKKITDPWTEIYRILLLQAIVPEISTALVSSEAGEVRNTLRHILSESMGLFNCQLARIEWLMEQTDERYFDELKQLLALAEINLDDALRKSDVAKFYQQKAQWFIRQDMLIPAIESYQKSIDIWFHPENQSVNAALKLYKLNGNTEEFNHLIGRINSSL